MKEYIFFNGKFTEAEKAVIPVRTHAFLYGTSVFEGIRAYHNPEDNQMYIFRPKEHFERLVQSAKIMLMKSPYSIEEYIKQVKELLKKNRYEKDVYIRPTLYKSGDNIGPGLDGMEDSYLVFTTPFGDYYDMTKGLDLCISSWRRTSDNAIPPRAKIAGAYVNAALINTDAHKAGFDDAIVLSESGNVTEGSAMNLIFIKNGKLITTNPTDDILEGVTRNTILQLAKDIGFETVERTVDRSELYTMDEIFVCGTGAQITPVRSIDKRMVSDGNAGEITKQLQKLYFDVTRGKISKYKDWCIAVYD